jgi:hypothetical protein
VRIDFGGADMTSARTSSFHLPGRLAAKADPALIADDEARFVAIDESIAASIDDVERRLDAARLADGGEGQASLDRDLDVHRLSSRLRTLRRFGLDLCLGRTVEAGPGERAYIGRAGLTDAEGRRLLVDWRAPAAEPYFAATPAHPMGLASRRRYRWANGRVSDYWDEVLTPTGDAPTASLDDQSAFIASLGTSRSPRMRDVLSTIQSDQDAIIRASARGALVVEGGPGTGKTVVALHRAAYLLYSDTRLAGGGGGVLFVGPHAAYLAYVDDVLPSLGEDSVRMCTLSDLVPEGAGAEPESDARVAVLKGGARWTDAIDAAVRLYEAPPADGLVVETPWADVPLTGPDWTEAFAAVEAGTPHDDARDQVWQTLADILVDRMPRGVAAASARRFLGLHAELRRAFDRAWPLLDPAALVASLWSNPGFLARCAPWLTADEIAMLQRDDGSAWTIADLPLLDAARHRIGDPGRAIRRRRDEARLAAQRDVMDRVVDDLVASDDSEMLVMSMLRREDARNSLVDDAPLESAPADLLAGPFAHVIVDEAQELTDAEWHMLLRRCPSGSLTIVGDRAQARHGFTEPWRDRLQRVGLRHIEVATLTVNYRTPEEIMAEAEPVIRQAVPDANVPESVRRGGAPVVHGSVSELGAIVDEWLEAHDDGIACVIGHPAFQGSERVRSLTPETARGLEFDLVVLVDPERLGSGIEGIVDRYVSMTRSTRELVILTTDA